MKPGYKRTDVGVIPEEWEVKPLSSLSTDIGDGIHSTPNYVKSSEFHFVNGNNLVTDRIAITDSTMCVSEAEYKTLRKNLTNRTLLLSINGTIGSLAFYNGEQVVLGKSAAYISVGKGVSRRFISYCLRSRPTSLFFDNELTGTTIRNLSLQSLRNTPIPLPPTLTEQRAIAEALSDVDALLGALDRLIAKKRDLKQAAMQQLLTGQTRLHCFHGEWEVKRLGELIVRLKRTARPSSSGRAEGAYPFFTNTTKPVDRYLNEADFDTEAIIANTGGEAYFNYFDGGFAAMADCFVFETKLVTRFLYYFLKSVERTVNDNGFTGSGIKHLDKKFFYQIEVRCPAELAEQTAIAGVLGEMDAELAGLEQRREKTRALKQAMMQELLTGRTRLV